MKKLKMLPKLLTLHKIWLVICLMFVTIGCDQATKMAARDNLQGRGSLSYLGGLLRLEHAENPGAFLSMGAALPHELRIGIFIVCVSFFLFVTGALLLKSKLNILSTIGFSLILGGGVGNLIDRIAKGTVTDFLVMGTDTLHTGIFNVADMAIVLGVCLVMLPNLSERKQMQA
jgi:signal peptidase II